MEGEEIKYDPPTFDHLGKKHGEVVAVFSRNGKPCNVATEKTLYALFQQAKAHNEQMPYHLKALSSKQATTNETARLTIQEFKTRHGIPLDTPPVELIGTIKNDDHRAALTFTEEQASNRVFALQEERQQAKKSAKTWFAIHATTNDIKQAKNLLRDIQHEKKQAGIPLDTPEIT